MYLLNNCFLSTASKFKVNTSNLIFFRTDALMLTIERKVFKTDESLDQIRQFNEVGVDERLLF